MVSVASPRFAQSMALATVFVLAASATAQDRRTVRFGPNDVPTVFAIGKSDDNNQVQYALRLTRDCHPVGREPVFGYWREYDQDERLEPMSWLDSFGYGIGAQAVTADAVRMTIKTAPERPIEIEVSQRADGTCAAVPYTRIHGQRARLALVYLRLNGPLSVSWVELRGTALDGGEPVVERITP